jgi:RNA polymerase sigma factor (sigma-70 family)
MNVAAPLNSIVDHLRRVGHLCQDGLADSQLLERFLAQRDAAAFEALVRRHGPMVHGVCLRVLHNHHDAEDTFQATFLVLAHKAASIVSRRTLSSWLYGVAYHTALKARADGLRRRAKEKEAAAMPKPQSTHEIWFHLEPLFDAALSGLPDKYRTVIVLCDLEGKTRKEAARLLDCPEGTIASRLARARDLLAGRLARQGLTLSAATVAEVLAQGSASASVPSSWVNTVVQAAGWLALGQTLPAGAISPKVVALKEGVLKTMLVIKLKMAMAVLLVLALIGVGATFLPALAPAQDKNFPKQAETNSTAPMPQREKAKQAVNATKVELGPTLLLKHVILDEMDVERRTISITVDGAKDKTASSKLTRLSVPKDVEINVGGLARGKLQPLPVGTRLTVELAVEQNHLVVAAITMELDLEKGEPVKSTPGKSAKAADFLKAEGNLRVAKATLDLAKANRDRWTLELKRANKLVQQGALDQQTLEETNHQCAVAEKELVVAQVRFEQAAAEFELVAGKEN